MCASVSIRTVFEIYLINRNNNNNNNDNYYTNRIIIIIIKIKNNKESRYLRIVEILHHRQRPVVVIGILKWACFRYRVSQTGPSPELQGHAFLFFRNVYHYIALNTFFLQPRTPTIIQPTNVWLFFVLKYWKLFL